MPATASQPVPHLPTHPPTARVTANACPTHPPTHPPAHSPSDRQSARLPPIRPPAHPPPTLPPTGGGFGKPLATRTSSSSISMCCLPCPPAPPPRGAFISSRPPAGPPAPPPRRSLATPASRSCPAASAAIEALPPLRPPLNGGQKKGWAQVQKATSCLGNIPDRRGDHHRKGRQSDSFSALLRNHCSETHPPTF